MAGPETPTETDAEDESLAANDEYVDVPRSTVESLIEFADSDLDSLVDFAIALAAIKTFTTPGEIASNDGDTVQLPREAVDTFQSYFSEFDTDEPDVSLLFDEEFWAEFDDATATARRALAEQ